MLLLSGRFARVDALLHLCAALLRLCCALRLRDAVEQLLHRDAEKLRQLQHRLDVRQRLAALPLGYGLVGYPEHGGQLLLGQAVLLAEGGDPPAHRAVLDHLACLLALRALRARGRFVESECPDGIPSIASCFGHMPFRCPWLHHSIFYFHLQATVG